MLNRYTTGPFHHCFSTECLNENYSTMTCRFWQVFFYLLEKRIMNKKCQKKFFYNLTKKRRPAGNPAGRASFLLTGWPP